jgi:hypothetical protein
VVHTYGTTDCAGAPSTTKEYSMNVCSETSAKYGSSVEVKCSTDATQLPLQQDAIMERYNSASNFPNLITNPSNHHI